MKFQIVHATKEYQQFYSDVKIIISFWNVSACVLLLKVFDAIGIKCYSVVANNPEIMEFRDFPTSWIINCSQWYENDENSYSQNTEWLNRIVGRFNFIVYNVVGFQDVQHICNIWTFPLNIIFNGTFEKYTYNCTVN